MTGTEWACWERTIAEYLRRRRTVIAAVLITGARELAPHRAGPAMQLR